MVPSGTWYKVDSNLVLPAFSQLNGFPVRYLSGTESMVSIIYEFFFFKICIVSYTTDLL